VAGCIEESPWQLALEIAQTARTIFLLGATDTGKTTFLAWLANALYARGQRVAVVDADIGQSSVGPPTTIGLALLGQPIRTAHELVPVGLYFVGAMSPRAHLLPMIVGTKRLVDRGHALGAAHVLVDTSGFITGDVGRTLKQYKISLVAPDLIICFQRAGECEGILRGYRRSHKPQVLRLDAAVACRRRGMEERRWYREGALQRYFADAQPVRLSWPELNLVETPLWHGLPLDAGVQARLIRHGRTEVLWAEQSQDELRMVTRDRPSSQQLAEVEQAAAMRVRAWSLAELQGTLLGLLDDAGDTRGLALLQRLDFANQTLIVLTPRGEGEIAGIQ
jgi:polynucleotide 5'-hydroxyl-kinase GRC3/NOL9